MAPPVNPHPIGSPEWIAFETAQREGATPPPAGTAPSTKPPVSSAQQPGTSTAPPTGGARGSTPLAPPSGPHITNAEFLQRGGQKLEANPFYSFIPNAVGPPTILRGYGDYWVKANAEDTRNLVAAATQQAKGIATSTGAGAAIAGQPQAPAPSGPLPQVGRSTANISTDPITGRQTSFNAPGTIGSARSGPSTSLPYLPQDNSLQRGYINPRESRSGYAAPANLRDLSYDISRDYSPQNPFAAGANAASGLSFDYNQERPGGESLLMPTGMQTAEIRSPAGDWGVGFNYGTAPYSVGSGYQTGFAGSNASGILPSYGYAPTGDPVQDALLAASIITQRDQLQAGGMSLADANNQLMADAVATSPTSTATNAWGSPEMAGADMVYSDFVQPGQGYTFSGGSGNWEFGADYVTDDPTAHINLKTGESAVSSEYGQPERITVTPMTEPGISGATTGLPGNTGAYGGAPAQGYLAQPRQTNATTYTAPPPYVESTPAWWGTPGSAEWMRNYAQSDAQRDAQGRITSYWGGQGDLPPYAIGQPQASGATDYWDYQTGMPYASPNSPPSASPPVTTPPPIGGGPGTGGPGTGNPGTGGPIGGGGQYGALPPEIADSIRMAREQRLRDSTAYQYGIAGLPRPQGIDALRDYGSGAGPGLYFQEPNWGQQTVQTQQDLIRLGPTGNADAIRSQIASLNAQIQQSQDPTMRANLAAQIDKLQSDLSRAEQGQRLTDTVGNMRDAIGGNNLLNGGGQFGEGVVGGPQFGVSPEVETMAPQQANSPMPQAPDISRSEFNWLSKRAPAETGKLLQLDYALNQYGDVDGEAMRQASEVVEMIQDEGTRVRAEDLLRRIVQRKNMGLSLPPLSISPPPDNPIAMLALSKFQ